MSEVVDLDAFKRERSPHWEGVVKCLGCGHETRAVGPVGVFVVDCEACGLPKAHCKHPFFAAGGQMAFTCSCGCEAFYVRKNSQFMRTVIACMNCGIDQTSAVFGE